VTIYVRVTGLIFGLVAVAHLLRIVAEWPRPITDVWFLLLTALAVGLCVWSWRLLRPPARSL
jgi:hypothetical protein